MDRRPRPINDIDFLNELPAFYARDAGEGDALFRRFLMPFEEMFAGLQAAIAGDVLTLTYRDSGEAPDGAGAAGYLLPVGLFDAGCLGYPKSTPVFIPGDPDTTLLAEPIPANGENIAAIRVTDRAFRSRLREGDRLVVRTGSGLAGLASIGEMPPSAFKNLDDRAFAYLQYLASWVGLPLRSDKSVGWNRRFLREAVALDNNPATLRSTLPGIKALLDAWHHEEAAAQRTVVTDLISPENGVDTVFCLGGSRIGIDTLLGEGEPGHFAVYLTADPDDVYMRQPKNLDAMAAAAELMLNLERPAGTDYRLHIHAHTMRLAPNAPIAAYGGAKGGAGPADQGGGAGEAPPSDEALAVKDTNTFARIGVTTLLWGD
ncbi:MAG: hypothetical protein GXX99_03455 [Clostridiales bacterium]|nr:hypothetical protein [Clostridiales bacterium]